MVLIVPAVCFAYGELRGREIVQAEFKQLTLPAFRCAPRELLVTDMFAHEKSTSPFRPGQFAVSPRQLACHAGLHGTTTQAGRSTTP
jgi:hypothetical protein